MPVNVVYFQNINELLIRKSVSLRHPGLRPGINNKKEWADLAFHTSLLHFLQRLNRLKGPCLGSRRGTPVIFDNLVHELNCECLHTSQ